MVRAASIGKDGKKKGAWSPEEDEKLRASVETLQKYGHNWNWHELPKYASLLRCGRSCRFRWMNYLRPNVKRGNYTKEEEDLILKLHQRLGNKWSEIAARLPGRSDNEVKNHWNTHIKKRLQKYETAFEIPKKQSKNTKNELAPKDVANSVNSLPQLIFESSSPTSTTLSFGQLSSLLLEEPKKQSEKTNNELVPKDAANSLPQLIFGSSSPTSPTLSFSELSSLILEEPKERSKQTCELAPKDVANSLPRPIFESSSPPSPTLTFGELSPLSCDHAPLRDRNWIAEDGISSSSELMFSEPIGNFWTEPFLVDSFDRQNEYSFNLAEERSMSPDPDYFHFDCFFYQALQDFLEN